MTLFTNVCLYAIISWRRDQNCIRAKQSHKKGSETQCEYWE